MNSAKAGETAFILTNQTPFYGESGGQVGDQGVMSAKAAKATVTDTEKKLGALHAHLVEVDDRRIQGWRMPSISRSMANAAAPRAPTIPPRIFCMPR